MDVTEATRDQMTRQHGAGMLLKDEDKISASMVSALKEAKEKITLIKKRIEDTLVQHTPDFHRRCMLLDRNPVDFFPIR
jgi:hypothetical protein